MACHVVWIASAADTCVRLAVRGGRDDDASRPSLGQSSSYNVNQLCVDSWSDKGALEAVDLKSCPPHHLVGLMKLSPDFVYDDLRPLTAHQSEQHKFFRRLTQQPLDGKLLFWNVCDVVRVEPFPLDRALLQKTSHAVACVELQEKVVEQLWAEYEQEYGAIAWVPDCFLPEMTHALVLPQIYASLVVGRLMPSVALPHNISIVHGARSVLKLGSGSFAMKMVAAFPRLRLRREGGPVPAMAFGVPDLEDILRSLRGALSLSDAEKARMWADAQAPSQSGQRGLLAAIADTASSVQRALDERLEFEFWGAQPRYTMYEHLDIFRAVHNLKNSKSYRKVLLSSAHVVLPPAQARLLKETLQDSNACKLPTDDSGHMSRVRLRVDVGWMIIWQKKCKRGSLRTAVASSLTSSWTRAHKAAGITR